MSGGRMLPCGGCRVVSRVFRVYIILFIAVLLLSSIGAALAAFVSPAISAVFLAIGWGILGVLAIWDGISRLSGHSTILGGVSRLGRVLAVLQIIVGLVLIASVLSGVPVNLTAGILSLR